MKTKQKPTSPRPPHPPGQSKQSNQDFIDKIAMYRKELERQNASQGIMAVFDSMCVYLGEIKRGETK